MSIISKPYTFSAGTVIVAAEHNSNFDTIYSDYNGNITNANISASAAIVDTKLAQITTASKVAVSAIVAGALPLTSVLLNETTAPTTAAGQGALYTKDTAGQPELFYREESSGDEVQITTAGAVKFTTGSLPVGTVIQVVNVLNNTHSACNTAMPADNTIPQSGEGTEVMTLAITPVSTTDKLKIDVVACVNNGTAGTDTVGVALFQDSTADALCAQGVQTQNADDTFVVSYTYYMTAGTTSATTFKVRVGNTGGNADFNGDTSARFYGTAQNSSITITEIKAS